MFAIEVLTSNNGCFIYQAFNNTEPAALWFHTFG